jgi:hypothetical protein
MTPTDQVIQCTVFHCATTFPSDLSNDPKYEALSYVWGDVSTAESIKINGHPFHVTIAWKRRWGTYTVRIKDF